MKVTLHGEELDFHDDDAIRSHAVSFAIHLLKNVPQAKLRREFERFFAQVYFLNVKAGGVLAYHQLNKDTTVPIDELDMILTFLRAALNEGTPSVSELRNDGPVETSLAESGGAVTSSTPETPNV